MPLETASTIADLVSTNPVGASDTPAALDDHIRLIKTVLKADALVDADIGVNVAAYSHNHTGVYQTDADALALLNASGSAPVYACRAWVNFNGTGTVAIRASGNVSSITDNGVGDYTVNFTTAMQDANYAAVCMATYSDGPYITGHNTNVAQTASTFRAMSSTTGGGLVDSPVMSVAIFR